MILPAAVFAVICLAAWRFRQRHPILLYVAALVAAVTILADTNAAPRRSTFVAGEFATVVGILGCVVEMARIHRRQRASRARTMDLFNTGGELIMWRIAESGAKSGLEAEAMKEMIEASLQKAAPSQSEQLRTEFTAGVMARHARLISDPGLNWKALLQPRERAAEEAWEEDQRLSQEAVFAMVSALILLALAFIQAFRH